MNRLNRRCVPILLLAAVAAAAAPMRAAAWGGDGHKIVAQIAQKNLTPKTAEAVKAILGEQTMMDVASWADDVRNQPAYLNTRTHHYVNIKEGEKTFDLARDCPPDGCVVKAIIDHTAALKDAATTPEKRLDSLRFLIHFVGDLHQPLHASRAADRGGNSIRVTVFGYETNLHSAWDSGLIQRKGEVWDVMEERLFAQITDAEREKWASLDPAAWAQESWELAMSNAYDVPASGALEQEYYEKNIPVIETRLKMAGIRLANKLNEIFDPKQK